MRYRKRPIVIEAFRLGHDDAPQWWQDALDLGREYLRGGATRSNGRAASMHDGEALIHTLEGVHRAHLGDWIIRGVRGELYPCRHDIFLETYDEVGKP